MTEDLELFALGRLAAKKIATTEAHLRQCEICRNELIKAERVAQQLMNLSNLQASGRPSEQRKSHRIATDDPAVVKLYQAESVESVSARILDVSSGGLRLLVPRAIAPGTMIQVHLESAIVLGEVRYCIVVGDAFSAGVQIEDVVPERAK